MPTESPPGELGALAPSFSLNATDGNTYTLDDLKGPRGLVIVFMCNHCPYVKTALPGLIRDARHLREFGINVAGINSNDGRVYTDDAFEHMITLAQEYALPFPYLHDETQSVARDYGAVCTPECFGFDGDMRLKYRRRIDASRKEALPDAHRDLLEAMRAIAEHGDAPGEQYPALGCSIKWTV
ncbi:PPO candidate 1 [Candidatus Burkholderia verschuerenii]|uniref:PPO candidate 1 n=1 Tax=Candidatus Burkholderia verschuerenii TaxID=242163 RepID=A0A0L0MIA1_9BURK|nr:thioredoxin family protein [Candidatus Burkholderia verschuerenii]KND62422.1 PPO candidate 1 [Candidatus Burkholderia verschuerenii]